MIVFVWGKEVTMPRDESKKDGHGNLIEGTYGVDSGIPIKTIVPKPEPSTTNKGGADNGSSSARTED